MSELKGLVDATPSEASETIRTIVRPPPLPTVNFPLSKTPATMVSAEFLIADSEATRLGYRLLLRVVLTETMQAALRAVGATYHGFMPQPGDEDHERSFDDIGSARAWLKVAATSPTMAERADRMSFPQRSYLIAGPARDTPSAEVATEELIERDSRGDVKRVTKRPVSVEQAALR